MVSLLAVGIGAGLVSALLFAVVVTGSPIGLALSFVAPLPIFIAALGWQHRAGLVAAAAGSLVVALTFRFNAGIAFALGWGLPAWWIAYLSLLGRARADGALEWYPLGRLLLWVAGTGALVAFIGVVALGGGDYDAYRGAVRRALDSIFSRPAPSGGAVPQGDMLDGFVASLPFFVASSFTMVLALNLWLAARAVSISGRLPRPWPFIPHTVMPRSALALLGVSVAAGFLPGFPGALGLGLAGALFIAFALQGLALAHDASRGRPNRTALLAALYVFALFLSQIALPLLAVTGIADAGFGLRRRLGPGRAGPGST